MKSKYKVYRMEFSGAVIVEIVEAYGWQDLFNNYMYSGTGAIFKVEAYDGELPPNEQ